MGKEAPRVERTEELMGRLREAAAQARARAYVPYSRFAVGAAVLGEDGRVYAGANVENASYGLTVCAERVAIYSAVGAGSRRLYALAVVTGAPEPAPPCGACCQVLAEFANQDAPIVLANVQGQARVTSLAELLPQPFRLKE